MDDPRTHLSLRDALGATAITLVVAAAVLLAALAVPAEVHVGKVLAERRAQFAAAAPRVVLLGNSMVRKGVDQPLFERLTGLPTLKLDQGGSETAYWYLELKNVIVPARRRPELVVVFFRDHFLTEPTVRVQAPYADAISEISLEREELLQRLAYGLIEEPGSSPPVDLATLPVRIRARSEKVVKRLVAKLLGRKRRAPDEAIARMFDDKNLAAGVMTARQLAVEQADDAGDFDFARKLTRSFLPSMIELCRDHGIRLVFVRTKRRRDIESGNQPEVLTAYLHELQAYFVREDVPFVDFTDDPELKLEHFADGDHLDPVVGAPVFTEMLAGRLAPYLPAR